jgi:hypothetical protein
VGSGPGLPLGQEVVVGSTVFPGNSVTSPLILISAGLQIVEIDFQISGTVAGNSLLMQFNQSGVGHYYGLIYFDGAGAPTSFAADNAAQAHVGRLGTGPLNSTSGWIRINNILAPGANATWTSQSWAYDTTRHPMSGYGVFATSPALPIKSIQFNTGGTGGNLSGVVSIRGRAY